VDAKILESVIGLPAEAVGVADSINPATTARLKLNGRRRGRIVRRGRLAFKHPSEGRREFAVVEQRAQ
jgi:hypothetical protein